MDIGGVTAEEINAVKLADILDTSTIENFGWGINTKDGKRREGTFYVGPGSAGVLGTEPPCEESAPVPEEGFIQPWIEFGRTEFDFFYGITSFVTAPNSFDKLEVLWTEFNTGLVLGSEDPAEMGDSYTGPGTGYKLKLFDEDGIELVNGFNDL